MFVINILIIQALANAYHAFQHAKLAVQVQHVILVKVYSPSRQGTPPAHVVVDMHMITAHYHALQQQMHLL